MFLLSSLVNRTPRDVLLKTAALFEERPELFNFSVSLQPTGCNTLGCALGWMATLAQIPSYHASGRFDATRIGEFMGHSGDSDFERIFYRRMNELDHSTQWSFSALACARALRWYADAYHPA